MAKLRKKTTNAANGAKPAGPIVSDPAPRPQLQRDLDSTSGSASWGLSSRSEYQHRVCELEMELSRQREELEDLRCKAALLESSRDYYLGLYQSSPVSYLTLDEFGRVLESNAAFEKLVGMTGEMQGLYFTKLVAKEHVPSFIKHLYLAGRAFQPVSCQIQLKTSGRIISVELISSNVERNEPIHNRIRTFVLDVSAKLRVQEAKTRAQSDFKALVDTVPGILWAADAGSLRLTYISQRVETLLGYPLSYWTSGATWEPHIHTDDRVRVIEAMQQLTRDGLDTTLEYRMVRVDRQVIWVRNNISASEINQQRRLFGVVLDITDRKETEEQLHLAHDEL